MKAYQHIIIISVLVLFTMFFYQDGFGSVSFLIAAFYLAFIFFKEIIRNKKSKEV